MTATDLVSTIADRVAEDPARYADDAACLDLLWRLRFSSDGRSAECPRCGVTRRFHRIRARPSYSCDSCGLHIHPTAGTPFQKSSTPLSAWFAAIARLSEDPQLSAVQLQEDIGVAYKTAWRMSSRLRSLLEPSAEQERPKRADEIVRAAATAIAKRGFASTRMSDIAREAGTSTGTVHYYFRRREDVLLEALQRASLRPLDRLRSATTEAADPRDRIAKLLELAVPVGALREEYVLWLEMWNLVVQRRDLLPAAERIARVTREPYLEIVRAGAAAGLFTLSAPVEEVAERIMSMVDALAFKCVVGYSWMSPEHMRELLFRFAAAELGLPFEELDSRAHERPS